MPKGRFTALDLRRVVRDMQSKVVGFRIANIYDINGRTYLFKLAQPGAIDQDKLFIVVESGVRLHTTRFSRDRREVPSVFTMKLRKAIKTKRLESLRQLGYDRLIDMKFGAGDNEVHLIVEFYAAGNIILTDKDYKITALLRSYSLEDGTSVAVNEKYPIDKIAPLPQVSEESIKASVSAPESANVAMKELLMKATNLGADVVEHCLVDASIDPKVKAAKFEHDKIPALVKSIQSMMTFLESGEATPGYIITKAQAPKVETAAASTSSTTKEDPVLYESFQPYRLKQTASASVVEFQDFDIAVDEYFSKIESQRVEAQRMEQEQAVHKRLGKVKEDQQRRVKDLESQEQKLERQARLIEQNVALVDAAINAVNKYLASQIAWDKLTELVKQEKKKGDLIASIIHKMRLPQNSITLLLYETLVAEEDLSEEAEQVDIDLTLTAHGNATEYYAKRKKAAEKRQKTEESAKMAMKSAERKAMSTLKEVKTKANILKLRKPYWFEKFNWFISSDGYIVVSGRDMQQNELLYKRYLHKGDVYIHADIHGASTVIVKNPMGGEIPPRTLSEAGTFSICYSKAWKSKIVTSAWWVHDDQVSKTAPSGEFLTTGSFMIRGKKNFLPPSTLVMGLGILFRLADESIPGYVPGENEETNDSDDEGQETQKASEAEGNESQQASSSSSAAPAETATSGAVESSQAESETKTADAEQPTESVASSENTAESDSEEGEESGEESDEESILPIPSGDYQIDLTKDHGSPASTSSTEQPASGSQAETDKSNSNDRKRKLSRKEREQLKRQQQGLPPAEKKPQQANQPKQPQEPQQSKGPAPQKVPRGKRGKLKKMQQKYGDQDEEERQAMMELLKSAGTKQKEAAAAVEVKQAKTAEQVAEEAKRKMAQKKEAEAKRVARLKEEEELRNALREEKLDELSDADRARIQETTAKNLGVNLAALTSNPTPDQVVMFAIPVCAPYEALQNFKYRVKITPGTLKKGKAAQLAVSVFMKQQEATPQEKELIKAIPDGEFTGVLIPNVKLSTPGLASILQQKSKGKGKSEDVEITE